MNRGRFIVFEGGDGAGKDTQIDLLRSKVNQDEYVFVRDPGSTEIGEQLRKIVLFDSRVSTLTSSMSRWHSPHNAHLLLGKLSALRQFDAIRRGTSGPWKLWLFSFSCKSPSLLPASLSKT